MKLQMLIDNIADTLILTGLTVILLGLQVRYLGMQFELAVVISGIAVALFMDRTGVGSKLQGDYS